MMGHNHVIAGALLYLAVDWSLGSGGTAPDLTNCLAAAALGSLAPDLDSSKSYLGRRCWPVSWTVTFLLGHRGFTHSLLAGLLVFFGLAVAGRYLPGWSAYFMAFGIGYTSHVLADWFTTEGVPLFWPHRKKFRSPLHFRTGGSGELLFSLAAGSGLGWWFYRHLV